MTRYWGSGWGRKDSFSYSPIIILKILGETRAPPSPPCSAVPGHMRDLYKTLNGPYSNKTAAINADYRHIVTDMDSTKSPSCANTLNRSCLIDLTWNLRVTDQQGLHIQTPTNTLSWCHFRTLISYSSAFDKLNRQTLCLC